MPEIPAFNPPVAEIPYFIGHDGWLMVPPDHAMHIDRLLQIVPHIPDVMGNLILARDHQWRAYVDASEVEHKAELELAVSEALLSAAGGWETWELVVISASVAALAGAVVGLSVWAVSDGR